MYHNRFAVRVQVLRTTNVKLINSFRSGYCACAETPNSELIFNFCVVTACEGSLRLYAVPDGCEADTMSRPQCLIV